MFFKFDRKCCQVPSFEILTDIFSPISEVDCLKAWQIPSRIIKISSTITKECSFRFDEYIESFLLKFISQVFLNLPINPVGYLHEFS